MFSAHREVNVALCFTAVGRAVIFLYDKPLERLPMYPCNNLPPTINQPPALPQHKKAQPLEGAQSQPVGNWLPPQGQEALTVSQVDTGMGVAAKAVVGTQTPALHGRVISENLSLIHI